MNYDLKYRTVLSSCPLAFVLRAEGRTDLCRLKEWFTNRRWIRTSNIVSSARNIEAAKEKIDLLESYLQILTFTNKLIFAVHKS